MREEVQFDCNWDNEREMWDVKVKINGYLEYEKDVERGNLNGTIRDLKTMFKKDKEDPKITFR